MNAAGSQRRAVFRPLPRAALALLGAALSFTIGCASPGPPRPPSLQLPQPVGDLKASREGDSVVLQFTLPNRTTDGLPLRDHAVQATLCRAIEAEPCLPIPGRQDVNLPIAPGASPAQRAIQWADALPASFASGPPRPMMYRVQLSNLDGRSAAWSDSAYTIAGAAPPPVAGLHAEETRQGILLRWTPAFASPAAASDVLLERSLRPSGPQLRSPAPSTSPTTTPADDEPVWLESHASATGAQAATTLDTTAREDVPFRYAATRRVRLQLGERQLEMRSELSASVEITWRNLFPPPEPTGLSAAPFQQQGAFAVDLVWEPVEEPGLRGYLVTRQPLNGDQGSGQSSDQTPAGPAEPLTPSPIPLPTFHDTTALPSIPYRYSVRAVGRKGTESQPASVTVAPSTE